MNIIDAIREMCKGESGFEDMFDKAKSQGKLAALTGGDRDAALFETLLYGAAREALITLINDAYRFREHSVQVFEGLMSDGLSALDARKALELFFTAFGFPGYREMGATETLVEEEKTYKTVYEGETRNGKPHGVGVRNFYYQGKWTNLDECVWIDGVMCGYDYARELEFGVFEDQKIGFVVNDFFVGAMHVIASDGEEFDDNGRKLKIHS